MSPLTPLPAGSQPQIQAWNGKLTPTASASGFTTSRIIVAVFVLLSTVLAAAAPGSARIAFPAMSFVVATILFRRSDSDYISFTWWLYFLAPLVRRIVDYRTDYVEPSTILLAPLLASIVCCFSSFRSIRIKDRRGLAFILPLFTVLYSIINAFAHEAADPISIAREAVSWTAPIGFGLYLYQRWRNYEQIRNSIQSTFAWGMLLMGSYAVIQVVVAPAWDMFWMENADVTSIGYPRPMEFRAFSTMNSQQPLALMCLLGLFLIVRRKGILFKLASIAGYLGLLLSMSRGAWLGWAVAMLTLACTDRSRKFLSVAVITSVLFAVLGSIAYLSPLGDQIGSRLQSLTQGENDESASARLNGYKNFIAASVSDPFGGGFGTSEAYDNSRSDETQIGTHDSMVLELLKTSGWFGCLAYGLSILAAAYWLVRSSGLGHDSLTAIPAALLVGLIAHALLDSMTGGAHALALWTCLGLGLAGSQFWTQSFVKNVDGATATEQV